MSESSLGSSPNLLPRASPSATAAMLTPNTRLLQTCKSSQLYTWSHTASCTDARDTLDMPFSLVIATGIDISSMHAADPAHFVTAAMQGKPATEACLASLQVHLNTLIEGVKARYKDADENLGSLTIA